MKSFCCEVWKSSVTNIKEEAGVIVIKDEAISLITASQLEAISLWSNYCPSCGLGLKPDTSQVKQSNDPTSQSQSATSTVKHTCVQCNGTGFAGGIKDGSVKCLTCLGEKTITQKVINTDKVATVEELKTKIRKENKPLREDAKKENYETKTEEKKKTD